MQLERKSTPIEPQIHSFCNAPCLLSESNKNPLQKQVERDRLARKRLLAQITENNTQLQGVSQVVLQREKVKQATMKY